MLQDVAHEFKTLERYDFRVLGGVETGMRFFNWVPADHLPSYSRLAEDEVNYRLRRLSRLKLVQRETVHYVGYKLTFTGFDALAIYTLVKRGIIRALGGKIGVGKESDIYDAQRDDSNVVAVKFHREGVTFRHVKRARGYMSHAEKSSWMLAARRAAESEYRALTRLYGYVKTPEPIAQNRHVIVMELLDGQELGRTELAAPLDTLREIIDQIKLVYGQKIVHSDLSEYNIVVRADGDVSLIDWSQWVPLSHPDSNELLRRDVNNVLSYFARKYKITKTTDDIIAYVTQNDIASV
ncbi:MAG: RIO1 family regulatory kinase/ATPase domain-containing protein [Halobacteriota archaeon]